MRKTPRRALDPVTTRSSRTRSRLATLQSADSDEHSVAFSTPYATQWSVSAFGSYPLFSTALTTMNTMPTR